MVPFFGYGELTTSSAAVESSFKKSKNVTFKHTSLPVDIEEFLETHIMSLQGASLIQSTVNTQPEEPLNIVVENVNSSQNQSAYVINDCPLCNTGNLPMQNGSHKCILCGISVHALPSCSTHEFGQEERRLCKNCSQTQSITCLGEDHTACENWIRRSKKQANQSYLMPNPLLRHSDINNPKNMKLLPILKNELRAEELKNCTIADLGKVILSNTCAFDTLASIFMTELKQLEYNTTLAI